MYDAINNILDLFLDAAVQVALTCALGLDGGVCACPAGVGPTTPCTPELRGRFDGDSMAAPGGGEEVPVGGEEVPVL